MKTRLSRRWTWPAALALLLALAGLYGLARASTQPGLASGARIVRDHPLTASQNTRDALTAAALEPGGGLPGAEVSEGFYNFGAIGAQEVVRHDFLVTNRGSAPLVIRRAYTTCRCTTAEISASNVPPGMSALVTVIFDAGFHNTRGQTVRRGLILETNDPNRTQVELWVQAKVR
jgi:hypothetical protein